MRIFAYSLSLVITVFSTLGGRAEPPEINLKLARDHERAVATRSTPSAARDADKLDLSGGWRLFLPAGFERPVTLTKTKDDRYQLQPGVLSFAGDYRIDRSRLVSVRDDSDAPNPESYTWRVRSLYLLVLDKQTGNVGADYTSAILFRPKPNSRRDETTVKRPHPPFRSFVEHGESVQADVEAPVDDVEDAVAPVREKTRWEHRILNLSDIVKESPEKKEEKAIQEKFDELGGEGWEFCQIHLKVAVFKRPIHENRPHKRQEPIHD